MPLYGSTPLTKEHVMAFNKAPSQSTYQTKDVKLIQALDTRNAAGTTDFIPLNGFFDIIQDKDAEDRDYFFVKRDGTEVFPYVPSGTTIRGLHFWKEEDKLLIAYDSNIAIVTASTGTLVTTITPFVTTSGEVGFIDFQYASGVVKVVACDGSRLITIDSSNVVVTGSDPDMPTSMEPHPTYLDGYLFVIKAGTSDIYNSNLDNPLAYTSGDFITAEMSPDTLKRIDRTRNYIVAFGTQSIEYFYDAANASGSPLNRNDTPFKQVGYLGGLVRNESRLFFVGQSDGPAANPEVYMMEDFKMQSVSNPPLQRFLQPTSVFYAGICSQGGRNFYILNSSNISYMVDIDTGLWTRISFKQQTTFPIIVSTAIVRNGVGNTTIMAFSNSMRLVLFNPGVYQDDGEDFVVRLQTDKQMFDTMHEKYMSRVLVVGDRPTSSATLQLRWTDDDYQTYSSFRNIELNQEFPNVQRMGRFRRRAFDLWLVANVPWRVRHLEVDFNIGTR